MANVPGTGEFSDAPTSTIRDVAVDGYGFVYSVGSALGTGMVRRRGTNNTYEWVTAVIGSPSVAKVAGATEGGAWVLRNEPRQILRYSHGDELVWTSIDVAPLAGNYADLAADSNGNAYLVGNVDGAFERFGIARFDSGGGTSWVSYHDDPEVFEAGFAIATLPTGGILGLGLTKAPPDHSTISRTRRRLDVEVHHRVFTWVLTLLGREGLVKGKTIGIDATTLEANAALRNLVRRDDGQSYQEFLVELAKAEGIEEPTREDIARIDRERPKKGSNEIWVNPHEPDAEITKMKANATDMPTRWSTPWTWKPGPSSL